MGNDKSRTNIIALDDHGRKNFHNIQQATSEEDSCVFIVDMLDRLMRIAAKEDQSVLVYLLAMARIEAMEPQKNGE